MYSCGLSKLQNMICRFDDPDYRAPASYNDLLSYYNQRDHKSSTGI